MLIKSLSDSIHATVSRDEGGKGARFDWAGRQPRKADAMSIHPTPTAKPSRYGGVLCGLQLALFAQRLSGRLDTFVRDSCLIMPGFSHGKHAFGGTDSQTSRTGACPTVGRQRIISPQRLAVARAVHLFHGPGPRPTKESTTPTTAGNFSDSVTITHRHVGRGS